MRGAYNFRELRDVEGSLKNPNFTLFLENLFFFVALKQLQLIQLYPRTSCEDARGAAAPAVPATSSRGNTQPTDQSLRVTVWGWLMLHRYEQGAGLPVLSCLIYPKCKGIPPR